MYYNLERDQMVLVLTPSGFTNHGPEPRAGRAGQGGDAQDLPTANSGFSNDPRRALHSGMLRQTAVRCYCWRQCVHGYLLVPAAYTATGTRGSPLVSCMVPVRRILAPARHQDPCMYGPGRQGLPPRAALPVGMPNTGTMGTRFWVV